MADESPVSVPKWEEEKKQKKRDIKMVKVRRCMRDTTPRAAQEATNMA